MFLLDSQHLVPTSCGAIVLGLVFFLFTFFLIDEDSGLSNLLLPVVGLAILVGGFIGLVVDAWRRSPAPHSAMPVMQASFLPYFTPVTGCIVLFAIGIMACLTSLNVDTLVTRDSTVHRVTYSAVRLRIGMVLLAVATIVFAIALCLNAF